MEQELPAFRKTIAVSIEGRSYEEARTNLEEQWVDGIVRSMGVSLLIDEICNIEDHPEAPRDSLSDIPLYPARVIIAALTDSRRQADAAFSQLLGSMSSDFSGADLYFDAMDSGPAEEGTITPPEHYDRMKRMEELRRQQPHTLWTDLKNLWYEALGVSLSFRPSSRVTSDPRTWPCCCCRSRIEEPDLVFVRVSAGLTYAGYVQFWSHRKCIDEVLHPSFAPDLDLEEAYGELREDRGIGLQAEPLPCCLCARDIEPGDRIGLVPRPAHMNEGVIFWTHRRCLRKAMRWTSWVALRGSGSYGN